MGIGCKFGIWFTHWRKIIVREAWNTEQGFLSLQEPRQIVMFGNTHCSVAGVKIKDNFTKRSTLEVYEWGLWENECYGKKQASKWLYC